MPCSFVTLSSSVMNCFPPNAVWCMDLCLHAKEKRKDHLQGFRSWSHECPVVKPGFAIPNIQVICDFTGILWLVIRLWSPVYKGKVNTNYDVNVWFLRELIDQGNVEGRWWWRRNDWEASKKCSLFQCDALPEYYAHETRAKNNTQRKEPDIHKVTLTWSIETVLFLILISFTLMEDKRRKKKSAVHLCESRIPPKILLNVRTLETNKQNSQPWRRIGVRTKSRTFSPTYPNPT